jgi:hypothetical protein
MSEFDKLKDDAEQEVKDHPHQVHEYRDCPSWLSRRVH